MFISEKEVTRRLEYVVGNLKKEIKDSHKYQEGYETRTHFVCGTPMSLPEPFYPCTQEEVIRMILDYLKLRVVVDPPKNATTKLAPKLIKKGGKKCS